MVNGTPSFNVGYMYNNGSVFEGERFERLWGKRHGVELRKIGGEYSAYDIVDDMRDAPRRKGDRGRIGSAEACGDN